MSYKVQKLPNEPIILTTLFEDYEPLTEMVLSVQDTLEILDAATEPMTLVLHLKAMLDMEQIIYSANIAARGDRPTWTHPNTQQVIMATTNPIAPVFSEGMRSDTFRVNFALFQSLDDALVCARSHKN